MVENIYTTDTNNTETTNNNIQDRQYRKLKDHILNRMNNISGMEEKLETICRQYCQLLFKNRKTCLLMKQTDEKYRMLYDEKKKLQNERDESILIGKRLGTICYELQKQNKTMKEERQQIRQQIREQEEIKTDLTEKFENGLLKLTSWMKQYNDKYAKIYEENVEFHKILKSIYEVMKSRELQSLKDCKKMKLDVEAAEAKLAKAKLDAATEREKFLLEKQQLLTKLKESKDQIIKLQANEMSLRSEINTNHYNVVQERINKNNRIHKVSYHKIEDINQILILEKERDMWQRCYGRVKMLLQEREDIQKSNQQRDFLEQLNNGRFSPEPLNLSRKDLNNVQKKISDQLPDVMAEVSKTGQTTSSISKELTGRQSNVVKVELSMLQKYIDRMQADCKHITEESHKDYLSKTEKNKIELIIRYLTDVQASESDNPTLYERISNALATIRGDNTNKESKSTIKSRESKKLSNSIVLAPLRKTYRRKPIEVADARRFIRKRKIIQSVPNASKQQELLPSTSSQSEPSVYSVPPFMTIHDLQSPEELSDTSGSGSLKVSDIVKEDIFDDRPDDVNQELHANISDSDNKINQSQVKVHDTAGGSTPLAENKTELPPINMLKCLSYRQDVTNIRNNEHDKGIFRILIHDSIKKVACYAYVKILNEPICNEAKLFKTDVKIIGAAIHIKDGDTELTDQELRTNISDSGNKISQSEVKLHDRAEGSTPLANNKTELSQTNVPEFLSFTACETEVDYQIVKDLRDTEYDKRIFRVLKYNKRRVDGYAYVRIVNQPIIIPQGASIHKTDDRIVGAAVDIEAENTELMIENQSAIAIKPSTSMLNDKDDNFKSVIVTTSKPLLVTEYNTSDNDSLYDNDDEEEKKDICTPNKVVTKKDVKSAPTFAKLPTHNKDPLLISEFDSTESDSTHSDSTDSDSTGSDSIESDCTEFDSVKRNAI